LLLIEPTDRDLVDWTTEPGPGRDIGNKQAIGGGFQRGFLLKTSESITMIPIKLEMGRKGFGNYMG